MKNPIHHGDAETRRTSNLKAEIADFPRLQRLRAKITAGTYPPPAAADIAIDRLIDDALNEPPTADASPPPGRPRRCSRPRSFFSGSHRTKARRAFVSVDDPADPGPGPFGTRDEAGSGWAIGLLLILASAGFVVWLLYLWALALWRWLA